MSTHPQRMGKYELLERLGQGGIAEVWKALDTQLQRYVAIKLLHPNLQEDPNFIERFQNEARLIASLHHPNIVQIHDFQVLRSSEDGNTGSTAFMVMDYINGPTLAQYIRETSAKGSIPLPIDIVHIFTSLSLAIDYAHQKGMIHRDIKPANILIDTHNKTYNPLGEPILSDFGVAKLMGASMGLLSGLQQGTPIYISPEQAGGYAGNERSDLYSLGIILYEMVTGRPPFQGSTPLAVLQQHISETPISPGFLNPNIPPALTLVILRSIAKDPAARFPSAASMTAALAEALNLPVPERLGQPAYPVNLQNMPTIQQQQSAETLVSPSRPSGEVAAIRPSPATASTPPLVTPTSSRTRPSTTPGGISEQSAALATVAPQSTPPITALPPGSPAQAQPRRRILFTTLTLLAIFILLGAGLGSYFVFFKHIFTTTNTPPASPIVGHAFFVSSGQIDPGSSQGIADQLQIDLQGIPDPQAGNSYAVWLLGDKIPLPDDAPQEPPPLFKLPFMLTNNLPVNNGTVHYTYQGDAQHDNLISVASRLLITEQLANANPSTPSTDRSTWRYYAEIPQTPFGSPHSGPDGSVRFRALDHIRHLFYRETTISLFNLPGGLDTWLFHDTAKLLEWAVSARDDWQNKSVAQMQSKFTAILSYLDGSPNIHIDGLTANDLGDADPAAAQIGILTVDPNNQGVADANGHVSNPPGYIEHTLIHIRGVLSAPDITPEMRKLATEINIALNNATGWLEQARQDAKQLYNMSGDQLLQQQGLAVLDDLVVQITYGYIGRLDPATNKVQNGVLQAHYDILQLGTLNVTTTLPQSLS